MKIIKSGFDKFLMKPIQLADLIEKLMPFLKHSLKIIDTKPPRKNEGPQQQETIPPEILTKLPEIISELEHEPMKSWEIARKNGLFDDIALFGNQIKKIGHKYSLKILQRFGNDLNVHVGNFDIEKITADLNSFPELLAEIKSLYPYQTKEKLS